MSLKRPSLKKSPARRLWQRRIARCLSSLGKGIAGLANNIAAAIRRIRARDQLFAILLLLVWIALLFSNFYIRGVSRFEGNLITKTISFTYVGDVDKQFLNSLR